MCIYIYIRFCDMFNHFSPSFLSVVFEVYNGVYCVYIYIYTKNQKENIYIYIRNLHMFYLHV